MFFVLLLPLLSSFCCSFFFFFFNDTATTDIYTLSLHDALPILPVPANNSAVADNPSRPLGVTTRNLSAYGRHAGCLIEANDTADREDFHPGNGPVRDSCGPHKDEGTCRRDRTLSWYTSPGICRSSRG